jgi:hypothetical protein
MNKLLRSFIPSLDEHLSDDRLASLVCGELSLADRWIVRRHLAECWQCRLRKENLEGPRSKRMLDLDRQILNSEKLSEEPQMEFSQKLRLHISNVTSQKVKAHRFRKTHSLLRISLLELPSMNPALVTCMVFGFATILSFCFWWQQRTPRITSNTLLVRAERWDTPNLASTPGVVYQSVRITMSKHSKKETRTRSIYRDTQGKRSLKRVNLDAADQQIQSTLIAAGLDWNEPLSATGYQNWHDHQHVRADNIVRAGSHLLRLTTTVPDGLVAEQSLTVRDTDFHPVKRTVALRDNSTVEVAELDYKILPWAAVDTNLFEPIGSLDVSIARPSIRVLSFPRTPETLSESELDEAELSALLILNRLHADTGEQIKVHRLSGIVEADGLVESEDRKRELQTQLAMVPHLTVSIRSIDDLQKTPDQGGAVNSVKSASMPDHPSPLGLYLQARGQSVNDVNGLAERFFNSALTISQESKAIAGLQSRFAPGNQRTVMASATLAELIYSHRERLKEALIEERKLLSEVQDSGNGNGISASDRLSLLNGAERNLALSKELIETDSTSPRNAASILIEMSATVEELTSAVRVTYEKPQGESALNGKN